MLQLPSGQESQQVMLQVRFAEVNRRALTELGANFVVNRADYARPRRRPSSSPRPTSTTDERGAGWSSATS